MVLPDGVIIDYIKFRLGKSIQKDTFFFILIYVFCIEILTFWVSYQFTSCTFSSITIKYSVNCIRSVRLFYKIQFFLKLVYFSVKRRRGYREAYVKRGMAWASNLQQKNQPPFGCYPPPPFLKFGAATGNRGWDTLKNFFSLIFR